MPKFEKNEIVVGTKDGWQHSPCVILGETKFPNGQAAYRMRDCLPEYDLADGTQLPSGGEFFMHLEYVELIFISLWKRTT